MVFNLHACALRVNVIYADIITYVDAVIYADIMSYVGAVIYAGIMSYVDAVSYVAIIGYSISIIYTNALVANMPAWLLDVGIHSA